MTKTLFRYVVGGSIALLVGSVALLLLVDVPLPPELGAWVEAQADSEWTWFDIFAAGAAVVSVVANIGLLFFARWSRPAFAGSVVAVTAATLFTGPSVTAAIEAFFSETVLLLDGFIIAVNYFSDVRHSFTKADSAAETHTRNV